MTPRRLHLRNFLSYGEAAPELDFEGLHVACLSGGNGQGKSALLDAITWALWGEARKASDSRKPDDDLLRIGARAMEVRLEFELDGERYRVARSYTKTASGKSSKPGLEVQVAVPGTSEWRPLTAGSVRETQAVLSERLSVDYETFVNSTFLLQGRSDEFTRKKPTERKQILGRILDLARYDTLHEAASRRYSGLRETIKRLEAETARLVEALGDVEAWEAEAKETAELVAERKAAVESARGAEAEARRGAEALDRVEAEAGALRAALDELAGRVARLGRDRAELAARVAEAEALVARGDEIEARSARFEALRTQRAALDEKATLHRRLTEQLHSARHALERRVQDQEARAERLGEAVRAARQRLDADTKRLEELPAVAEQADAAQRAAAEAERLARVRAQRREAEERVSGLGRQIDARRQALTVQRSGLQEQVQAAEAALAGLDGLRRDAARLTADAARHAALVGDMERVREDGQAAAAEVTGAEAELAALARERAAVEARRRKVEDVAEAECPTCGTALTPGHRATVVAGAEAELAALARREQEAARERDARVAARDALRARYKELQAQAAPLAPAAAELAAAQARLAAADERRARLDEQRAQVEALTALLDGEAFLPEARAEVTRLTEALAELPFDEDAFVEARTLARSHEALRRRRTDLQMLQERVRVDREAADKDARALAAAREGLASGKPFEDDRRAVAALEQKVVGVGFDEARFEAVQRDLDAHADAPAEHARLTAARTSLRVDADRDAALAAELAAAEADRTARAEALEAVAARLAGAEATRRALAEATAARAAAEASLSEAQTRLGAITERLDRAGRDRETLRASRAELRTAKKDGKVAYHLRTAFSKNGIPSLIIEETLPEIEARANAVLDRLSRGRAGRTQVALETLKDKKTGGGTKETLDIRITDEGGVSRPYETFSGGEAFRVNFALRIALSQILADRAGTPIRTLVIDEGFGTQDKEGIAALVEAIRAIQDDFDLILVVTHLDELKQAFPVRIEVEKRPVVGSTFEIVGV